MAHTSSFLYNIGANIQPYNIWSQSTDVYIKKLWYLKKSLSSLISINILQKQKVFLDHQSSSTLGEEKEEIFESLEYFFVSWTEKKPFLRDFENLYKQ